jgi:hypothetical protein
LRRQRKKLAKQIGSLDRQIAALAGKPGRAARRPAARASRPRARGKALPDYIRDVLAKSKKGMRVKEIEAAVRKAGYRTKSKDFYGAVAAAVREGRDFQKVSRGVYKLRGKPAGRRTAKKAAKASRKKTARAGRTVKKAAKKAPNKRARAKNKISLRDALAKAMQGKDSMTVAEAVRAVESAGYKSTSKAFRALVNQTLSREGQFESTGRGVYRLKAG